MFSSHPPDARHRPARGRASTRQKVCERESNVFRFLAGAEEENTFDDSEGPAAPELSFLPVFIESKSIRAVFEFLSVAWQRN
jgi:hypothetical protein